MFRESSVDQEDKKDAPEPLRHSTGKHGSLSLMQIRTPIQKVLGFFKKEVRPLCVSVCLPHFFFSVYPRQADVPELVRVERRLCLSVSQLFPGESRCVSLCNEVSVIQ